MERLLTASEAFQAMREFLREFNRREPQEDRLALDLLLSWTEFADDGTTFDPAQWDDWRRAVQVVMESRASNGPTTSPTDPTGLFVQLRIDNRVSLVLESDAEIVIDEPFELHSNGRAQIVPPTGIAGDVGGALSLLDQRVVSVQPDPTGVLTIDFEGGDRVVVPVNQSYENWQLLYSDGTMLIGLPGGGITKYPPRPPAGAQE